MPCRYGDSHCNAYVQPTLRTIFEKLFVLNLGKGRRASLEERGDLLQPNPSMLQPSECKGTKVNALSHLLWKVPPFAHELHRHGVVKCYLLQARVRVSCQRFRAQDRAFPLKPMSSMTNSMSENRP